MSDDIPFTAEAPLEPGVSPGLIVIWDPATNTGTAIPAAMLVDTDGTQHVISTGDSRPVTIVDDTGATS